MKHLFNIHLPLLVETPARRRTRQALLAAFHKCEQRARERMSKRAWEALGEFLRVALHWPGTPILLARELACAVLASEGNAEKVSAAAWLDVLLPRRLLRPENNPAFVEALDLFRKRRPECQGLTWWECVCCGLEDAHTEVAYRQRRRWA